MSIRSFSVPADGANPDAVDAWTSTCRMSLSIAVPPCAFPSQVTINPENRNGDTAGADGCCAGGIESFVVVNVSVAHDDTFDQMSMARTRAWCSVFTFSRLMTACVVSLSVRPPADQFPPVPIRYCTSNPDRSC